MFFKKKEADTTSPQPQDAPTTQATPPSQPATPAPAEGGKPTYQKPVLRRYDQIDQVKPYGPSEI